MFISIIITIISILQIINPTYLSIRNFNLMLCFGLWRLEGAGEQANAGIFQRLRHLGVRETLIQHQTVNQLGILQLASRLGLDITTI